MIPEYEILAGRRYAKFMLGKITEKELIDNM